MCAFVASALIAAGVMSGVPTMYWFFRLELTVLRPLKPITMAVIPKTMRIAAAKKPPISRNLRISFPPWCFDLLSKSQSRRPGDATSGRNRARDAGKPLLLCEEALLHRVPDELGTGGEVQL